VRDRLLNFALVVGGVLAGLAIALYIFFDGDQGPSAYEGIYRESADPILRVELVARANDYVNADGFFGRDYLLAKPAGVFRIVGLGDSVAMYYSAEELNHSSLLERSLPAVVGGPVEVLNLAVASYETPQHVRSLVVKGLKYDPDFVVVSHCINDGIDFVQLARQLADEDALGERPSDDSLDTHRLVRDAVVEDATLDWDGLFAQRIAPSAKWEESLAAYDRLADIRSRHGFGVLVLLFPALLELDDYYLAPAHAALRAHLQTLGFGVVDLTEALAGTARATGGEVGLRTSAEDAIHPSPPAYQAAADAAQQWFAEHRPWEGP